MIHRIRGCLVEEMLNNVKELKDIWAEVYPSAKIEANWKPHLPNISPEMVNEIVDTISFWLDRVRSPNGFSPGFHLARGLGMTSLSSAIASAKNLQAGQYNHLQSFINSLNQIISAIHTMVIYSPQNEANSGMADINAQLAQSISLINTGQKELAEKAKLLEELNQLGDKVKKIALSVGEAETASQEIVGKLESAKIEGGNTLTDIKDLVDVAKKHEQGLSVTLQESQELHDVLKILGSDISRIEERSKEQQALIASLLPKGASAGLASAFAARGAQLEKIKWVWMGLFIISIIGLVYSVVLGLLTQPNSHEDWWNLILHRLPVAAPLVWLGWFSAIQYGNNVRVQEDYAFKEATSKAFAGYRDHLEHLATVKLDDAKSAMNLMTVKTIEILAREPLRIFNRTDHDATPSKSLINTLLGKKTAKANDDKNDE